VANPGRSNISCLGANSNGRRFLGEKSVMSRNESDSKRPAEDDDSPMLRCRRYPWWEWCDALELFSYLFLLFFD
jgi:hypothetical protein